jgi:hypothetical protein
MKKTKKTSKARTHYSAMPPQPMEGKVADRQTQFRTLTRSAPPERGSERAFLASKLTMLRTHPRISEEERAQGEATLARTFGRKALEALDKKKTEPVPGGVGYGMFYTSTFRTAFARGTSFYYEIVCPTRPGGNVNTWLYLTATNRAQKGVEAFVAYRGQNDTRFKVFDWARSDQWQTNIPFANLTSYLRSTVVHGWSLQVLIVLNSTIEIGTNRWRNEVLLHNRAANRWDLVYRFDYPSTTVEQQGGWVGSWGPIVETFQNSYSNTARLGFLNTMLSARNTAGQWGNWGVLTTSQSTIRNDGQGFSPLFIDPNYTFVVKS